jgi:gamma-glutamylcyclotransferase (GGCT)/AIG2-like uncharacterized protein YtfP
MAYYFAYGSNADAQRLENRIKRKIKGERAELKDYSLHFSKDNTLTDAYADIIKKPGEVVYGVLYELTDKEIKILDKFEGIGVKGDESYARKVMKVLSNGKLYVAFAYIMSNKRNFEQPKDEYLEHIIKGFKEHGFNQTIIDKVKAIAKGRL